MPQFVTRLDEDLTRDVDAMVAEGAVASRSEAVRVGLQRFVDEWRRRRTGEEIAEGYRRQPQTASELAGVDESARAMIADEPW
jgi:Arc/MetJ-type ribon-helix-helix transcriptional regulator